MTKEEMGPESAAGWQKPKRTIGLALLLKFLDSKAVEAAAMARLQVRARMKGGCETDARKPGG